MKRKVLAILVPALLVAGAANAAEIYNKNGNKLDFYGKMVGEHIMTHDGGNNNSDDTSYARFGVKGETQISSELTGYGQFEYNIKADKPEGQQGSATRLAFAGLKFSDYGSFDYGRNYGVVYDAAGYTDMLVEWGGDGLVYTDNFMTGRTNGVATYRNTDFFGMVDGLNFALQYQGKNNDTTAKKSNGDGFGFSVNYNFDGFGFVGAYSNSDRTDEQAADRRGEKAEVWSLATKYDANSLYASVMYGESHNMTHMELGGFANKTQNIEAVVQYQFDFGLRPSLGYVLSKGKDIEGVGSEDLVNYIDVGLTYYFNKNMNAFVDYKINQLKSDNKLGINDDDIVALGMTYQF